MKAISIVCDSCGHHAADAPGLPMTVASTDVAPGEVPATGSAVPTACPCCGAVWTRLRAGDEFLVAITNVGPAVARRPLGGPTHR
jgi:hypothetical protein